MILRSGDSKRTLNDAPERMHAFARSFVPMTGSRSALDGAARYALMHWYLWLKNECIFIPRHAIVKATNNDDPGEPCTRSVAAHWDARAYV